MSEALEGNSAIEIHDSTLQHLYEDEGRLVAVLSAYVHRSVGIPGVSPGSGWSQTVHLRIGGGIHPGLKSPIPLVGGSVDLDGELHDNVIPWPLAHEGPVRIEFQGSGSERILLVGNRLQGTMLDDAKYIEEFPGE